MNTYIAHANNSNLQSGLFYSCSDGFKKDNDFNAVSEFNFLKDKDTLIYLIPSYLVSSYTFENNKKISSQNNVANFISEIDSNLVNDVSDNEFFLFEKNAYVIDKQKYKELNYALNFLKCNIILLPDYFICHQSGKDRITEFNDKFLFSFSNGTGNSIDRENIDTYLSVIQRSNPNFNPSILQFSKALSVLIVFDVEKMGRFLGAAELWGASHAMLFTNIRLYLNPISLKLEPVAFDASIPSRDFELPTLSGDVLIAGKQPLGRAILKDPKISDVYLKTIKNFNFKKYVIDLICFTLACESCTSLYLRRRSLSLLRQLLNYKTRFPIILSDSNSKR